MWWLFFFLPLILLFIPLRLHFSFDENFSFEAKILFFRIFRYETTPNTKKEHVWDKFDLNIKKIRIYLNALKEIFLIFEKHVRKKVSFDRLGFQIIYGNGNAAETAIHTGVLYSVAYGFLGYILNRYNVKKHDVSVTPDFDNKKTKIKFDLTTHVSLWWLISLFVQERNALVSLNNILNKKDGATNE